jgi:hypothetical protein
LPRKALPRLDSGSSRPPVMQLPNSSLPLPPRPPRKSSGEDGDTASSELRSSVPLSSLPVDGGPCSMILPWLPLQPYQPPASSQLSGMRLTMLTSDQQSLTKLPRAAQPTCPACRQLQRNGPPRLSTLKPRRH